MDLGIAGKTALVCAASKGLGRGCALALARNGVAVTITARSEDPLEAAANELARASGGEAELFFVAIRPGTYEFGPKGMIDRGIVGKIIVEAASKS